MNKHVISPPNIFYYLVIIFLLTYILMSAKVVLMPLVFSVFLALTFKPVAVFFEKKIPHRGLAILFTFFFAILPLLLVLLFFISQSIAIFKELPSMRGRVSGLITNIFEWLSHQLQMEVNETSDWITENITGVLDVPIAFIRGSVESTTLILANLIFVIVITFLLLLYRTPFKNFFYYQFNSQNRKKVEKLFNQIQYITQRYLFGLGIVIILLGILIGLGLWLIGVPYAFFWGFLGATLGIIPYIGTTIGGILPFFYVLAISTSMWQPIGVVCIYVIVQQIEGNLITPHIMGASIKINPLVTILGLFVGGVVWGIAGMILALPMMAVIKEVCRNFDKLTPLSYLMENHLNQNQNIFEEKFDHDKYRFFHIFFKEEDEG